MEQRTPDDKLKAIIGILEEESAKNKIDGSDANEISDGMKGTVIVDSCEEVKMVRGKDTRNYFFPGVEILLPSDSETEDRETAELIARQIMSSVDDVYVVNGMRVNKKGFAEDPEPTTSPLSTGVDRLRELGFRIDDTTDSKDDDSSSDSDSDKDGTQKNGKSGVRLRFEPYDSEVAEGRIWFEPEHVAAIVRHATSGVWHRLHNDYMVLPDDRDDYLQKGTWSHPVGTEKIRRCRGLHVRREFREWQDDTQALEPTDPAYLVNAIEAARKNAVPLVINDRVRFWNPVTDQWKHGVIKDIRVVTDRADRWSVRPKPLRFRWSRFWTTEGNTLVPCIPAKLSDAAPDGDDDDLHARLRTMSSAMRSATAQAQEDRAIQHQREHMACASASDSEDLCRALVFADNQQGRCEFVQDACRRKIDVLLERLRDTRLATIKASEKLAVIRNVANRRHNALNPLQEFDVQARLMRHAAKDVWRLNGKFFGVLRLVELELKERVEHLTKRVNDIDDDDSCFEASSTFLAVVKIIRRHVGWNLWQAVLSFVRESLVPNLRDALPANPLFPRPASPDTAVGGRVGIPGRGGAVILSKKDRRGTLVPDDPDESVTTMSLSSVEVDPGDTATEARIKKRIHAEARDRLSEVAHRLIRRRPMIMELTERAKMPYDDYLRAAQKLRRVYLGRGPCEEKDPNEPEDDAKDAEFIQRHDAANSPLEDEDVSLWLSERLHRAALEYASCVYFKKTSGEKSLKTYFMDRIRYGTLQKLTALPKEDEWITKFSFHSEHVMLRRPRRALRVKLARRINSDYLRRQLERRIRRNRRLRAGSDVGRWKDYLQKMVDLFKEHNAPLQHPDDFSAAARTLRRFIKLCLILSEEPVQSKVESRALLAVAKAFSGNKQLTVDVKDVETAKRHLARRLMPNSELVIDKLVEDLGVLHEIEEDATPQVPEYLVIRVQDTVDTYRVFEVVLPGSQGDWNMRQGDDGTGALKEKYPYGEDQIPKDSGAKDEHQQFIYDHLNTLARAEPRNLNTWKDVEAYVEKHSPASDPPNSYPRRLPRNRHATRQLLAQIHKVHKFLLENAVTIGAQFHKKKMDKLFEKYVQEMGGDPLQLEQERREWYKQAFWNEDDQFLYKTSVNYMRKHDYHEILSESLGTLVEQYISKNMKNFMKEVEQSTRNLEEFLIWKASERLLKAEVAKKVEIKLGNKATNSAKLHEIESNIRKHKRIINDYKEELDAIDKDLETFQTVKRTAIQVTSFPSDKEAAADAARKHADLNSEPETMKVSATDAAAEAAVRKAAGALEEKRGFDLAEHIFKQNSLKNIRSIQISENNLCRKNGVVQVPKDILSIGKNQLYTTKDQEKSTLVASGNHVTWTDGEKLVNLHKINNEYVCLRDDRGRASIHSLEMVDFNPCASSKHFTVFQQKQETAPTRVSLENKFRTELKNEKFLFRKINRIIDYGLVKGDLVIKEGDASSISPEVVNYINKFVDGDEKTHVQLYLNRFYESSFMKDLATGKQLVLEHQTAAAISPSSAPTSKTAPSYFRLFATGRPVDKRGIHIQEMIRTGVVKSYEDYKPSTLILQRLLFKETKQAFEISKKGEEYLKQHHLTTGKGDLLEKLQFISQNYAATNLYCEVKLINDECFVSHRFLPPKKKLVRNMVQQTGTNSFMSARPKIKMPLSRFAPWPQEEEQRLRVVDVYRPVLKKKCNGKKDLRGGGEILVLTPFARLARVQRGYYCHGHKKGNQTVDVPPVYYDDPLRRFPFYSSAGKDAKSGVHLAITDKVFGYRLQMPKITLDDCAQGAVPAVTLKKDDLCFDEETDLEGFAPARSSYKNRNAKLNATGDTAVVISHGRRERWTRERVDAFNLLGNRPSFEESKPFLVPVLFETQSSKNANAYQSDVFRKRPFSGAVPPGAFVRIQENPQMVPADKNAWVNFETNRAAEGIQNGVSGWDWKDILTRQAYLRDTNGALYRSSGRSGSFGPRSSAGHSGFDEVLGFRLPSMRVLRRILDPGSSRPLEERRPDGYWYRELKDPSAPRRPCTWGDAAAGAQLLVNEDARILTVVSDDDRDQPTRRVKVAGSARKPIELTLVRADESRNTLWGRLSSSPGEEVRLRVFPETSPDRMRKYLSVDSGTQTTADNVFVKNF